MRIKHDSCRTDATHPQFCEILSTNRLDSSGSPKSPRFRTLAEVGSVELWSGFGSSAGQRLLLYSSGLPFVLLELSCAPRFLRFNSSIWSLVIPFFWHIHPLCYRPRPRTRAVRASLCCPAGFAYCGAHRLPTSPVHRCGQGEDLR